MEIRDFLRGGSRLALLILVPLLAMAAAFALSADRAPGYRAVATVALTPPSGLPGGVAVSQAVETFQSALETETARSEAAEASGMPTGVLSEAVSSRRLGSSAVVEVVYEGPERPEVAEALQAQVGAAMELVFGGEVQAAEQQRELAQARFEEATEAFTAAQEEAGVVLAGESLRSKLAEVSQLRVAIAQAESRGDSVAPLTEALEQAEGELESVTEAYTALEQPQFLLERARTELADAEQRVSETQGRFQASSGETSVRAGAAAEESGSAATAQQVIAAGVIGLLVAIALIAALEFARPTRRRHADGDAPVAPATVAAGPGPTSSDSTPVGAGDRR
jgi:hypothetical protein